MEAAVGDRIVVAATDLGGHMRDGEIIKVGNHAAPPYLVHWFDDGRETLSSPVLMRSQSSRITRAGASGRRSDRWFVRRTRNHTPSTCEELARGFVPFRAGCRDYGTRSPSYGCPTALDNRGETRRNPSDVDVPEIGDEVAAARALRRLADRLLGVASDDIEMIEAHEVHLRP